MHCPSWEIWRVSSAPLQKRKRKWCCAQATTTRYASRCSLSVPRALCWLDLFLSFPVWCCSCHVQISVERQQEYTDLPIEPGGRAMRIPQTERQRLALLSCATTPKQRQRVVSAGEVVFNNVSVRYRPGLPAVLRGVSLRIPPGLKVGCSSMCERTRASSVLVS